MGMNVKIPPPPSHLSFSKIDLIHSPNMLTFCCAHLYRFQIYAWILALETFSFLPKAELQLWITICDAKSPFLSKEVWRITNYLSHCTPPPPSTSFFIKKKLFTREQRRYTWLYHYKYYILTTLRIITTLANTAESWLSPFPI